MLFPVEQPLFEPRPLGLGAADEIGPVAVRDLASGPPPGPAGLGADGAAQPAGGLHRPGRAAFQQPHPDGLFEVGRLHAGGRGLRGCLRGEQRPEFLHEVHAGRDAAVVARGFPPGRDPPERETPVSG